MDWILEMTTSQSYNFVFTFGVFTFLPILGVIIGVKLLKEAFRR